MAVNHAVEIFLLIAAWPIVRLDNWRELCHARAAENLCFLISCNSAGINCGKQYLGHSAIVDPLGTTIASASIYESVVRGEIDTAEIYKIRDFMPALNDRFLSV
jgi:predicted amidohydrolase